ncbi:MATH domain-containing protein [Ditylenchus destructor]|nr:MATH domain-containing protein [Ditylenchus destructor]
MANLVELEEQSPGGSMAAMRSSESAAPDMDSASVANRLGGTTNSSSTPETSSSFDDSGSKERTRKSITPGGGQRHSVLRDGGGGPCSDASSPGRSSNSTQSNSTSRTATSNGSLPRRSMSRECYNSSSEQDEESNQEDDLEQLIRLHSEEFAKNSVAVQTEYDEDFPPLKFLRSIIDENSLASMPMMFDQQQMHHLQQSPMVSIVPSSTSSSDLAAQCSSNAADGTLQLVIQNFRHMSDTVRGPSKFVQNVPWRIMVMPRQHVVQKKGTQKCLGFFLQCCPDAYSESWSCQASAELRLISQKPGVPNFTRKTNHVYTAKENDWGYSCFMTWADILDEQQGYIKDDKVILEVSVKADPPKNILSHAEFQKKIQDYKRLADMQCQRGLIDKAIDCNSQALKFCKDKDSQCKTELETQRAHLIEMKLKQSIERIEKGSDPAKVTEDDSAANLSALRSALGTNAARAASAKNNQVQKNHKSKDSGELQKTQADSTTPQQTPVALNAQQRSATPPPPASDLPHLDNDLSEQQQQNGVIHPYDPAKVQENHVSGCKNMGKSPSAEIMCSAGENCKGHLNSKALVALGHFNKALLNSDEFDYVKDVRYDDEEDLLTDQIQHYLQHLSEKDKESSRLKRFSAELEMLASPLETTKKADVFVNQLLNLPPREAEALTLAFEREMAESRAKSDDKRTHKRANRKNLCESCLREEHHTRNKPPPALPARQRKKATAKKNIQQQRMQTMQGGQLPKANPRQANSMQDINTNNIMQTQQMALNPCDNKQMLGGTLEQDLAALTAELEIGKLQNDAAANAVYSRHYIEEWLRYSARNVLKLSYDSNGKPFITTRAGNESLDAAELCNPQSAEQSSQNAQLAQAPLQPDISEVTTALGVIGLNCMNARNIQQKVADFVESLESHTNFRDLRSAMDRLIALSHDDDYPGTDADSISIVSVNDPAAAREAEMGKDFAEFASYPRTFAEEDPHDYMLSRELKQAEMVLSSRLSSLLYQLHHANINDVVDRVESRIKDLEEQEKGAKIKLEEAKTTEVRVIKQCQEVQRSLQTVNEKHEKLNQQLKDRKNEIKKLEKKAKSEAQLATENAELHDKLDSLKKEVSSLQRQINEEQMKYKRDTQSLADSKKHLTAEMNSRYSEIQKLTNQVEEKTQALKKIESQLANERKSNTSTVASLTERVKKAEISLLEHKLEDGLKVLERARDDCIMQIRSLEEQLKRHGFPAEQDILKRNIAEWESKREEVVGLINQAKTDFTSHINSIKSGKQLSQLPKIQVPRPPPCPKLHPMPPPPPIVPPPMAAPPPGVGIPSHQARVSPGPQHGTAPQQMAGPVVGGVPPSPLPLERKAITPPSSRARIGGATTPQQQQSQMHMSMVSPSTSNINYNNAPSAASSIPNSANATPVKGPGFSNALQQQQSAMQQPPPVVPQPPIAPIGVRPHNYQNGVAKQQNSIQSALFQMQQSNRQSPTQFSNMNVQQQAQSQFLQQQSKSAQQTPSGFQPWGGWGDNISNNISELFCQGRSFGPLGSDFGPARTNGSNTNQSGTNNGNGSGYFP